MANCSYTNQPTNIKYKLLKKHLEKNKLCSKRLEGEFQLHAHDYTPESTIVRLFCDAVIQYRLYVGFLC